MALRDDLLDVSQLRGEFTLRSGQRTSWYLDKWRWLCLPWLLRRAAAALAETIPPETTVLAGVELGGVPLTAAVAIHTGLPYAVVRRAAKGYGTARELEGASVVGQPVALLEDVLTTGVTAQVAAIRLVQAGARSVAIRAVFDRGGVAALRTAGRDAAALYVFDQDENRP